jgi:hypothetical protein
VQDLRGEARRGGRGKRGRISLKNITSALLFLITVQGTEGHWS